MQPYPLPPDLTVSDQQALNDLDLALCHLDRAFAQISDKTFAQLPREYRRLADAVLRVYRNHPLAA